MEDGSIEPLKEGMIPNTGVFALRRGLYAMVDLDALDAMDPLEFASRLLAVGDLFALQLRAKGRTVRQMLPLALSLSARCRAAGVPFVVNDRADVAFTAQACLHVGQDDLSCKAVRAMHPAMPVGVSTHCAEQWKKAAHDEPDYVAVGPVFATRSKQRPDPVLGLDGLRRAVQDVRAISQTIPIVAIGGVQLEQVASVRETGVSAVAIIRTLSTERGESITATGKSIHGVWS